MNSFKDREKAEEAKYAHDEQLMFRVMARRNKLLGLWAAELMDISGADADAYAKEVVTSDLEEPGEEDVYRKVMGDLTGKGVDISEHRLRRKMEELTAVAAEQVQSE
jgi:hypothetical protein